MQQSLNNRENHLVASKPSIRSGGFTLGGPRNSLSTKDSVCLKDKGQYQGNYDEDPYSSLFNTQNIMGFSKKTEVD